MYALNTFIRIANFVARSFVGLVCGAVIGYIYGKYGGDFTILTSWLTSR